mmetsp:Transcript_30635/g.101438  ORF Transcript_30635/g.101438 Transcript_30635/m.101438 type:complete len:82 (+) Transcript_30635:345-590(+)
MRPGAASAASVTDSFRRARPPLFAPLMLRAVRKTKKLVASDSTGSTAYVTYSSLPFRPASSPNVNSASSTPRCRSQWLTPA